MNPFKATRTVIQGRKLFVLINAIIFISIANTVTGQSFFKLYASQSLNANYCRDIIQTSDGGYVLAGGSTLQTDNTNDGAKGFIVKLNASGGVSWTKRFETGSQVWNGLVPTSDGNFLSLGAYDVNTVPKPSIIKYNNAGDILWQERISFIAEAFSCGILAKDGSNVLAGISVNLFSQSAGLFIVKINTSGAITWKKAFDNSSINILPSAIKELSSGGYIVSGVSTSNANDVIVVKLNANGDLVWSKVFGGADNDTGADVIEATDGGFLIAGSTASAGSGASDFMLTKLDVNGTLVWNKIYGSQGNELAYSMIPYENGNYLIMGLTDSYGSAYYDNYMLVVDGDGNVQQSKRITTNAGPELTYTHPQIIKNSDGAYVLAGNFINSTAGAPSIDIGILKFESGFSSCVNSFDAAYSQTSGTQFYTYALSTASRGNVGTLSTTVSTGNTATTICSNIPITNIKPGNWSDPSIWNTNTVPVLTDKVELNFDVTVDINADCWSLKTNNHQVYVNANILMNIHGK